MFKKTALAISICLTFFSSLLLAWNEEEFNNYGQVYEFRVIPKKYMFSTEFEIHSKDVPVGRTKKSSFRFRTHYDLADRHGWQATGITRMLSLGSLFPWAREIDIYDTQMNQIGMICGKMITTAQAKYAIYNKENTLVGTAFLDYEGQGFVIQHPEMCSRIVAQFVRDFEINVKDSWNVTVYEPEQIDFRILRIFAAFAVDTQTLFDDTEEIECEEF